MNDYAWRNRNRTNTAYVVGRRSSNNVVVGNRTNVIKDRVIINRNKPRLVVDKDVVIDRAIIKLKRNNNNIRVYENPNNVPNKIIIDQRTIEITLTEIIIQDQVELTHPHQEVLHHL